MLCRGQQAPNPGMSSLNAFFSALGSTATHSCSQGEMRCAIPATQRACCSSAVPRSLPVHATAAMTARETPRLCSLQPTARRKSAAQLTWNSIPWSWKMGTVLTCRSLCSRLVRRPGSDEKKTVKRWTQAGSFAIRPPSCSTVAFCRAAAAVCCAERQPRQIPRRYGLFQLT
jgi:hypothetical protein